LLSTSTGYRHYTKLFVIPAEAVAASSYVVGDAGEPLKVGRCRLTLDFHS